MSLSSPSPVLHVLVTAHPDDESMFFMPTLVHLIKENKRAALLCLSSGNYDGLGTVRARELDKLCRDVLHIPYHHVDDVLQDHPTRSWSSKIVAERIQLYLDSLLNGKETAAEKVVLVTFDQGGVSRHINHISVYEGVLELLETSNVDVEGWQLDTVYNPILKYFPVWELFISLAQAWITVFANRFGKPAQVKGSTTLEQQDVVVYQIFHPWLVWKAMATHASQFVWYRKLFVVFSRYSYNNTLRRMTAKTQQFETNKDPSKSKTQ